jgi:hypothetical protein
MTGLYVVYAFVVEEHQHAMRVGAERTDRARSALDLSPGPSGSGFGGAQQLGGQIDEIRLIRSN